MATELDSARWQASRRCCARSRRQQLLGTIAALIGGEDGQLERDVKPALGPSRPRSSRCRRSTNAVVVTKPKTRAKLDALLGRAAARRDDALGDGWTSLREEAGALDAFRRTRRRRGSPTTTTSGSDGRPTRGALGSVYVRTRTRLNTRSRDGPAIRGSGTRDRQLRLGSARPSRARTTASTLDGTSRWTTRSIEPYEPTLLDRGARRRVSRSRSTAASDATRGADAAPGARQPARLRREAARRPARGRARSCFAARRRSTCARGCRSPRSRSSSRPTTPRSALTRRSTSVARARRRSVARTDDGRRRPGDADAREGDALLRPSSTATLVVIATQRRGDSAARAGEARSTTRSFDGGRRRGRAPRARRPASSTSNVQRRAPAPRGRSPAGTSRAELTRNLAPIESFVGTRRPTADVVALHRLQVIRRRPVACAAAHGRSLVPLHLRVGHRGPSRQDRRSDLGRRPRRRAHGRPARARRLRDADHDRPRRRRRRDHDRDLRRHPAARPQDDRRDRLHAREVRLRRGHLRRDRRARRAVARHRAGRRRVVRGARARRRRPARPRRRGRPGDDVRLRVERDRRS